MSKLRLLLTPAEVAHELKLSLLTIYKYLRSRELDAVRFGRTYRISEDDLERFMKKNKVTKK